MIKKILIAVICLVFMLSIWLIYPACIKWLLEDKSLSNMGLFGDTYGGLNAIFSGCAMFAAIGALFSGIKDRQRNEFEEHFFQQVGFLRDIVSNLKIRKFKPTTLDLCLKTNSSIKNTDKILPLVVKLDDSDGIAVFYELRKNFDTTKINEKALRNKKKNRHKYEISRHYKV